MNVLQRIRYAFANLAVKSVATIVATWQNMKPSYSETKFPDLVKYGLRKNELIYACVTTKADTASQVQMVVTDAKSNNVITNHPLKLLLQRPNPRMTEFDFWYSVIMYLHLSGHAVYEKQRDRSGKVIALWPLRPDKIAPIASSTKFIAGYEYSIPDGSVVFLKTEDVLEFKLFDPLNPYNSWPPVAVAARVGDIDNDVTDFIKVFWEKGATPPAVLKTTQKLTDTQVTDLKRRWAERYGGADKWIEPAVLDKDADYKQVGSTFTEMLFAELDARNESRICAVLKVPPILVGAKVGLDRSTYTNYGEARRAWWEDTLIPLYKSFIDVIENQLVPEFDAGVNVDWDFSGVIALAEEQQQRWARALDALKGGAISVNEYRWTLGFPSVSGGDVFLRPLNIQQVASPPMEPALIKSENHPRRAVRGKHEQMLQDTVMNFLKKQEKEILDAAATIVAD